MRCAVIGEGGRISVEDREIAPTATGEALVRVLVAGICSTDLELAKGYMDFRGTPGHEFVGRVERAPASHAHLEGQRVVGEINAACHDCDTCREGLPRHCPNRTVLGILGRDGAMAETLSLPARNLLVVPDWLTTDRALFVEPAAAAYEVLEQVPLYGKTVLVMGAGKLGYLIACVLASSGADVTVLARHRRQIEALREAGLKVVDSGDELKPRSFSTVVEATGQPEGFESALRYVKPRGTVVLKSTCAAGRPLNLAPLVIDEITVVGSRCGPFEPALRALGIGLLAPERTIDGRFQLSEVSKAFEEAARPGIRKIVLDVQS